MAKHYIEVQELYVKKYVIKLPIEFVTDEEAEEYVVQFEWKCIHRGNLG